MNESSAFGDSKPLDLPKRLEDLDDRRLAGMLDADMVATIVQRRYLADLRLKDKWKKKNQLKFRKLRFLRQPAK